MGLICKGGLEIPSMLDAPVSGGVFAAESATLTFMVCLINKISKVLNFANESNILLQNYWNA